MTPIIRNTEILDLLQGKSCHGDIKHPLDKIFRPFRDIKYFCPDPDHFSYCFWYSNTILFAFGTGMQKISLRLPTQQAKKTTD